MHKTVTRYPEVEILKPRIAANVAVFTPTVIEFYNWNAMKASRVARGASNDDSAVVLIDGRNAVVLRFALISPLPDEEVHPLSKLRMPTCWIVRPDYESNARNYARHRNYLGLLTYVTTNPEEGTQWAFDLAKALRA